MAVELAAPDVLVPPRPLRVHPRAAQIIGEQALRTWNIAPFDLRDDTIYIAAAQADLTAVARFIQREYGYRALVGWEVPDLIEQALVAYFSPRDLPLLLEAQADAWRGALGSLTPFVPAAPEQEHDDAPETLHERLEALSLACDLPLVRIERWMPQTALARLLPPEFMRTRQVLPFLYVGGVLYVLAGSIADRDLSADLDALLGLPFQLALADRALLEEAIEGTIEALRSPAERGGVTAGQPHGWPQRARAMFGRLRPRGARGDRDLTPDERLARLAARLGLRVLEPAALTPEPEALGLLPRPLAERLGAIVLAADEQRARVAVCIDDPRGTIETLAIVLERTIEPALAPRSAILAALARSTPVQPSPPAQQPPMLDRYLLAARPLRDEAIAEARTRSTRTGESLTQALLALGHCDLGDIAEMKGLRTGIPWLYLAHVLPEDDALAVLPADLARSLNVLPLRIQGGVLHVAIATLDYLPLVEQRTGYTVRPVMAESSDLAAAIARLYAAARRPAPEMEALLAELQHEGRINRRQRAEALAAYAIAGLPTDIALERAGIGSPLEIARLLARLANVPFVDLQPRATPPANDAGALIANPTTAPIDRAAVRLLPRETIERLSALPIRRDPDDALVIAVADPLDGDVIAAARAAGQTPRIVVSPRSGLEAAIRRAFDRRNLGDYLLDAGIITTDELARGLQLHARTGVRLGKALLTLGYVTPEQLAGVLAEQLNVPFFELAPETLDRNAALLIPEDVCRRRGILPLAVDDATALLAMTDPLDTAALDEARLYLKRQIQPVIVTEAQFDTALEALYRREYLEISATDLLRRAPEDSAYRVLNRPQKIAFGVALLLIACGLIADAVATLTALASLACLFYFAFSAYKLYLIYKALARSLEVMVTPEDIAALDDRELPIYSVLVPMYREGEVLPILVDALSRLDYPSTKLEVLLLLEEDDRETLQAVRRMRLPESFRVIVVPHGQPKGKPKACNYGLLHARGEFVVLYDAEDVPEPDQIKKALIAFRRGGERLVTVQAKLNYFNRDQNLLTRWFTAEYSMWFDLLLPGLGNADAPIPLGGTSNHFRADVLRELGGWDPFNVTEDADLGIRLYKRGYRTCVINSTTYEEANSNLYNWIRQRSRWIKGYMQTWLVHMRHPYRLWREIGTPAFLSFQFIILGTFFAFLLNPIFWSLTALWFLTHWGIIEAIFPGPILYLGTFALYFGNFAFIYINIAGALRRGYHQLVKYILLTPLYWLLMSIAAWKAFYQLIFRPSYWEKTEHGLYRGRVRLPRRTRAAS